VAELNETQRDNRKEACKTFVEQTKLLVTLASAFVVAPAAAQAILDLKIDKWIIGAESLFIASVLGGYIALASVAGSQADGSFDVYRSATQWFGRIQFFSYLLGLLIFMYWLVTHP
jgi:hypothetical protein